MEQQIQLVTRDCGTMIHSTFVAWFPHTRPIQLCCRLSITHHPQTCAEITKIEFKLNYMSKSSLLPKCTGWFIWTETPAKPNPLWITVQLLLPPCEMRQVIRLQFAVRTAANLCAHNAAVGPGATEWCRHNTCYGKATRQHEHISSTWQIWKSSNQALSTTFAAFALMEFSQRVSSTYIAHLGT